MVDKEVALIEKISNSDNFLLKTVKIGVAILSNLRTMVQIQKRGKKIFLLLTPQYDNLGDHAIALSSIDWLRENFPEYSVVDITCNFYKNLKALFSKSLREDDVICITGGGFMGDMWMVTENMVRDIIRSYKSNKIIVMPQTVYFQTDREKKISKEIYTSNKNIYFALRDKDSYSLIKDWFGEEKVFYVPDIVTVFKYKRHMVQRQNIGMCFREDIEKVDYNISKEEIVTFFTNNNKQVKEISTLLKLPFVFTGRRKKYVNKKFKEIEHLELIVTNRLHCMIFAYLCGTPCLAFDNKSHKVSGGWEWLKDSGYIRMYDSNISLKQQINDLIGCEVNSLCNKKLQSSYKEFAEILRVWIGTVG